MIVKTYRLKPYQNNLIHDGRFYDSKYLQLNFLNAENDNLNMLDVHIAQLNAAHSFLKTKIQAETTKRLNEDLLMQSFIQSYNDENNIVNEIWDRINNLYELGVDIQHTSNKQLIKQQAEKCDELISQYSAILKLIQNAAQDEENNIIHSNILLTRLKEFNTKFENFEKELQKNPIAVFKQLTGSNGYLNMLFVYDRMLKGYVLEEDVVNKAKSFTFSNLKIADDSPLTVVGIGTLFVGGKMAPTDVLFFNKQNIDILDKINITYQMAHPGESEHKIEKKSTMKAFIKTMEEKRGEWNFYIQSSDFLILCQNSLMAIQAKASRPKASIKFKSDIEWSDFLQHFNGIETTILTKMYELYHLSAQMPKGRHKKGADPVYDGKSWYTQAMPQYAFFAQKALARNFKYIVGENNSFILTNEKGLETTGDFLLRKIRDEGWLFKWQNNYSYKTLNISRLNKLKYDIRLTL